MMRYEKALKLLAAMEHPKPPDMSAADHARCVRGGGRGGNGGVKFVTWRGIIYSLEGSDIIKP